MTDDVTLGSWRSVRRCPNPIRSILRHQVSRRRPTVLVAECDDYRWATSNLQLGATTNMQKLGLGLAKSIKRLYEVDVSRNSTSFTSVFETDQEGAIVEGTITIRWWVNDPVALIQRPKFDHLEAIRAAVEDLLRPIVRKSALDDVEKLAEKIDEGLRRTRVLREVPISWGEGDTLFRLTGEGTLHRHSLEQIRRQRLVDREQRGLDQERIGFYTDVIDSGKVSLLAMMLCNDPNSVRDVLSQIHTYDIPIGRTLLDDPFRNAVGRMMSEADDFDLHEMRLAWLSGLNNRSTESELNRLQDSLDETLGGKPGTWNNG